MNIRRLLRMLARTERPSSIEAITPEQIQAGGITADRISTPVAIVRTHVAVAQHYQLPAGVFIAAEAVDREANLAAGCVTPVGLRLPDTADPPNQRKEN